ncbi:MAG: hypothetical protein ACK5L3_15050 [Oscillospiraceae bacterium]
MPNGQQGEDYLSCDLHKPALVTSLTYQGLYAAWNRLAGKAAEGEPQEVDYRGFNLPAALRQMGVATVCMDEAHHLKAAWQKALEEFLAALQGKVTVVSLTATPPYDSTPAEWARYCAVCGDIDEEISAPALVQQGILCPHQDFVLFNYPTQSEEEDIAEFRRRTYLCVQSVAASPLFLELLNKAGLFSPEEAAAEWRCRNTKGVQALLVLAAYRGLAIPPALAKEMFLKGKIPDFTMEAAEAAFQFMVDSPAAFGKELLHSLGQMLTGFGVLVHKTVCLDTDARLSRRLAGSAAKLQSIGTIARAEQASLGAGLRMLVLTDFIGKALLASIGSGEPLAGLDAVSVFEQVRRSTAPGTPAAILTGTLVVLSASVLPALETACREKAVACTRQQLPGTEYFVINFEGGSRQKVAVLTGLFQKGHIHIMVGTKALLGEGWDSPCINSLVLASYVGSFVLSNQMRGRAIRRDAANGAKVSNIWHLVTLLPPPAEEEGLRGRMESDDFTVLKRRFECVMGPAYSQSLIENGLARQNLAGPPATFAETEETNRKMLALAANRVGTAASWQAALPAKEPVETLEAATLPYKAAPPRFMFANLLHAVRLTALLALVIGVLWYIPQLALTWQAQIAALAACLVATAVLLRSYYVVLRVFSPKKYICALAESLLAALQELGEISPSGEAVIQADAFGLGISCALSGAALREKRLFAGALRELLSPFDSPRYILVKQRRLLFWGWDDFEKSYACPSVIANHRKRIQVFEKHLAKRMPGFRVFFAANSRQALLQCLKHSYINRNGAFIQSKRLARRRYSAGEIAEQTRKAAWQRARQAIGGWLPFGPKP